MEELNIIEESFDMKNAIAEAKRCLRCKNAPCKVACPVGNDIPDFIFQLSKGNLGEARAILAKKTNLPAVCGRVCPHEKQCVGHCVLNGKGKPIPVGMLEQFVADFDADMDLIREPIVQKTRGKVAVIGSGPAGLTVAGDLARIGFNVVVYENESEPGGVLIYGIPEFRLPAAVVRKEIERIAALGVNFLTNITVGQDLTVDDIFAKDFDAIFVGSGTAVAKELILPGYRMNGVVQSSYFLRMVTLHNNQQVSRNEVPVYLGEDVLVIGGGNVAMDAARTALRIGAAAVTVVYRKTINEIPALQAELNAAIKEGVQFSWNSSPIEFMGVNDTVNGLKISKNSEEMILKASKILIAIGSRPAGRIVSTTAGINIDPNGYVITKQKPYGMTIRKGVFAGGDVVHQPATVVLAMKEAKRVAEGIAAYVDAVKLLQVE